MAEEYTDVLAQIEESLETNNAKLVGATNKTNDIADVTQAQADETSQVASETNATATDGYGKASNARSNANKVKTASDEAEDLIAEIGPYGDILNLDALGLYLDDDGDICQK